VAAIVSRLDNGASASSRGYEATSSTGIGRPAAHRYFPGGAVSAAFLRSAVRVREFADDIHDGAFSLPISRRLSLRLSGCLHIDAKRWGTPRGLRKTQILELAQNRWIKGHQSVLIVGPSGSGKSFLAQALGLQPAVRASPHSTCACRRS